MRTFKVENYASLYDAAVAVVQAVHADLGRRSPDPHDYRAAVKDTAAAVKGGRDHVVVTASYSRYSYPFSPFSTEIEQAQACLEWGKNLPTLEEVAAAIRRADDKVLLFLVRKDEKEVLKLTLYGRTSGTVRVLPELHLNLQRLQVQSPGRYSLAISELRAWAAWVTEWNKRPGREERSTTERLCGALAAAGLSQEATRWFHGELMRA